MQHTNRLSAETSPYLLQHAHNPVDWYPWGDEALQKARTENKPVLVSIGYSACHWCHVMERESFEDEETAMLMNENFVNIKIDREERPDLDHIYMDAVQAITGSGGWPLNVFLTPEGKPFYGGTYFPPRPLYNRPSWKEVLSALARSWREKKEEIEGQAQNLIRHLQGSNSFGPGKQDAPGPDTGPGATVFTPATLRQIYDHLMQTADRQMGGFGGAPKFPQTFSIRFLLHYFYFTREAPALEQACLSLDKMIMGGIYDQIGGGFARYSTDEQWLAPHFEKMLYDNALLIIVLSEAYQLTRKELYRDTIHHTMAFIRRELSLPDGAAFYSALDADSEGEEGKYYVWDKEEIERVLGEDSALFCRHYGVTAGGNWEGKNILTRTGPPESNPPASSAGARSFTVSDPALSPSDRERLEKARLILLEHRSHRIRPALDDKILLGWNALMNIACSKAFAALGTEEYKDMAIRNMDLCWNKFRGEGLYHFYHSYKDGQNRYPAFLDDYACLISALIQLQEITGDTSYLLKAKELTQFVSDNFSDGETGLFFFTHQGQKDLILRKKEIYDGAVPSGNSMMAFNLAYMSIIFNKQDWGDRAAHMAAQVHRFVTSHPGSFGVWATLYQALTYVIPEVVITGKELDVVRKEFLEQMIPYRVFQSATEKNTQFPLLCDRPSGDSPLIFLCKNYTCQLPVNEIDTFIRLLENVQKFRS
ncbi:MAG TPA: thioredoxin domain-containing protein [Puia sp.]|nr:thioredoxin domain-containing protein [Puia sp.]